MLQNSFIILPFSILHYNNPSTSTYQALIKYPIKIKTENGLEKLETIKISKEYTRWENYNTFYAFSPFIRPIPTYIRGAAIAQWICLRLPFCCPGFEFQAHHLRFFN